MKEILHTETIVYFNYLSIKHKFISKTLPTYMMLQLFKTKITNLGIADVYSVYLAALSMHYAPLDASVPSTYVV